MISVITSTFNRKDRLAKAIASVQAQTYQDYEHIIVDDGSTDGTDEFVKSLKDPKIRYFRIKHFGNHSRPKNEGIRQSKGEYIAFLDDDNEYRPDHLNVLIKALEREPSIDVVYGDRWVTDETNELKPQLGVFSDFDPVRIFVGNYIDTSDVLIRREAMLRMGGWDERYKKLLDWELWVRMVKAGYKFKRVPVVITNYHLLKSAMSRQQLDTTGWNSPAWNHQDVEISLPYLGQEPKEPKVAIFTITYDRLKYTKLCFASLKNAGYPFDHYVVDNGSTDGTRKWLEKWLDEKTPGKRHIRLNGDNKGISIASNQALEDMGKDYDIIVKVDNDCIFQTSGWLAKMVDLWKSNRRLALSCYVNGLKDNPGGAVRFTYGMLKGELIGMTRHLGGICHFVDADAYKTFRWPEEDTLHGFQDLFFSNYLLSQGYQMGYLENYYCSHGPLGTEGQYREFKDYFERRKGEKTRTYKEVHGE